MSTKIYDATKISSSEACNLFVKACYYGDTKDEVRNKEQAGVMISRYRYLRVSAELSKFKNLALVLDRPGERMLKGYWTFLRGLGL